MGRFESIRFCASVLALVTASLMFAGCAGVGNSESGAAGDFAGTDFSVNGSESKTESVTFSWWGNDGRHQYTMDGIDLFEEKNPSVKVDYQFGEWSGYERRNRVWMESASAADVMQINYGWLDSYSSDGEGYYDLNEIGDELDLSNYDEDDLKYGMKNGHLNAIPIAFNTQTFCFNKDLLDKYGFDVPKSWDDLVEMAEVVSKDDLCVIGMPKKHMFLMLVAYFEQATGKHVFDENGNAAMSKDDIAFALDFYSEMIEKKVFMQVDNFDRKKFGAGECLGSVFWVSDSDNYCGTLEENGFTPVMGSYLMEPDAKLSGLYMKPATLYAINRNAANPEIAAKLLNFLVSDPDMALLQGTEKGVPINKKALEVLEENDMLDSYGYKAFEIMQENKDKMDVMKPVMEDESLIDSLKDISDEYLYEKLTREEAIDRIYALAK